MTTQTTPPAAEGFTTELTQRLAKAALLREQLDEEWARIRELRAAIGGIRLGAEKSVD